MPGGLDVDGVWMVLAGDAVGRGVLLGRVSTAPVDTRVESVVDALTVVCCW